MKLSRRRFVQLALSAAAGSGVSCSASRNPWLNFTVDEARTLAAMCDQIIPPDKDPGASWAGVVNYVDRQLGGPFTHLSDSYHRGLNEVNQSSRAMFGADLAQLDDLKQTEVLRAMESGRTTGEEWSQGSSSEFFSMVIEHTMQGFYGDPRHGSNRDAASWTMLGIPYPPIRGRIQYDLTQIKPSGEPPPPK